VAAGAFHLEAEKRRAEDDALRGHRHIVLRGDAEAGRPAETLAALEPDQLGHEEIERFVVEERLVNPPAERAGVVERGLEHARIFREHILPVTHPVISPARISEQLVDELCTLVFALVCEKRG